MSSRKSVSSAGLDEVSLTNEISEFFAASRKDFSGVAGAGARICCSGSLAAGFATGFAAGFAAGFAVDAGRGGRLSGVAGSGSGLGVCDLEGAGCCVKRGLKCRSEKSGKSLASKPRNSSSSMIGSGGGGVTLGCAAIFGGAGSVSRGMSVPCLFCSKPSAMCAAVQPVSVPVSKQKKAEFLEKIAKI